MTEGAQEWRKDGNGGWRLVARLGGRVDSCLRRNDGGGAGMTEGAQEWRKGAQEWRKEARRTVGRSRGFLPPQE